jgi:hypothetical protein
MEDNAREELVSSLEEFRTEQIGAINNPVELKNGVVIQIRHWVRNDEELSIDIILPRRVKSPYKGQSLSSLESHFSRLVNEFNKMLEDSGFESPDSYVYTVEEKNTVTGSPEHYRFESTIPNPLSGD